ncbi:hypothetical protein DIS24_g11346 [Lasiodiplodia hormozganensis]|uniref:Uncharacterized protein n=1 Tax=Lasiodiplodia hormozganensis TaxID=869390 RepID=A0AA39WVP2_9PEZI|nr:hypothetical protein DIS24_g11346 [Lasiodiplodia hormozganensis]
MKFSYIGLIAAALAWPAAAAAVAGDADTTSALHNPDLSTRATIKCPKVQSSIVDSCKRWCSCTGGKIYCTGDDVTADDCKTAKCKC